MSRPLSSDYADARTLPDAKPALKLYAVSVLVWLDGEAFHMADFVQAKSQAMAQFLAMEKAKEAFPECAGFLRHDVNIVQIRL